MKKFTLLLLSCILAVLMSGCTRNSSVSSGNAAASENGTGEQVRGGEIRFGFITEPATLDPLNPSNTADGRSILFNIFEGLVKSDSDGTMGLAAAEDYAVEQDGLVYTFTLRKGLLFHTGSAVRPQDVVFSLNTAIQVGYPGLEQIEKVETHGERDIRITLKTPDVEFLPYLSVGIVPADNVDRQKNPVGTGPFQIASYIPQQSLVMEKNPYYWQEDLPYLDRVTIVFLADADAQLFALQGGNIDAANVTGTIVEQLDPARFDITSEYSNSVQMLALNNGVKPLDDIRVRQAVNYGLDVPKIIETAFYGRGDPYGTPVIPGLTKYFDAGLRNPYPADPQKAQRLLAEAGYPKGFPLEITVASNYTMHVNTAEVIVNHLAGIGIRATIKLVDWTTWLSEVYRERKYQATVISVDGVTVSPRSFLYRYVSDSDANFVNFNSPDFDQIYGTAVKESDTDKRIALYKEAQQSISDGAASVYIQDIYSFTVFAKGRYGGKLNYPLYVIDFSTIYCRK